MSTTYSDVVVTEDGIRGSVHPDPAGAGAAAGQAVGEYLRALLRTQHQVRVVFAAAPSQDGMLDTLSRERGIDWSRVWAMHMDEYVGLAIGSPESFSGYLCEHLFDAVRPGRVDLIDGLAEPVAEAHRYGALITAAPIDLVCFGIGENGHLAFNEPHDGGDPATAASNGIPPAAVRIVGLTEVSRLQQIHDGCFEELADVPKRALTVTIPALVSARRMIGVVVGGHKAAAVARTLHGSIDGSCPATAIRHHADCDLFLDRCAAGR